MFRMYTLNLLSAEPPSMAASVPAADTSAGVKAASVPTTTSDDKEDVQKLATELASNLSTKGKSIGLILRMTVGLCTCKSCHISFFLYKK